MEEFENWLRKQTQKSLYQARNYKDHPDVAERHYIRYWAFLDVVEKMKELDLID